MLLRTPSDILLLFSPPRGQGPRRWLCNVAVLILCAAGSEGRCAAGSEGRCAAGSEGRCAASALAAESLSDLTGPWQLFVDDYLVAKTTGVVRTYHAFEKHHENPIMLPDKPWMDHVVTSGVVLPNEGGKGYRMWHSCWTRKDDDTKHGSPALYSTSKDGIHWEMPILGLVPWIDGSLQNNFLPQGAHPIHTPFNADPKHRYTSMSRGKAGGYGVSFSEDGIHWEAAPDGSPLTGGSDVGTFHYDARTGMYRGYVKVIRNVSGLRRRCVALSATKDPCCWPPLELVMAPDDFDDRWIENGTIQRTHFYGCPVVAYETMYIGLLWIFRAEDDRGYFHGPVFSELVTSRDGAHWLREQGDRPPILEVGPPGSWDQGMNYTGQMLVENDTIKVYYTGSPDDHDVFPIHGAVGLATLRKDGFASLDSGNAVVAKVMTKRLENAAGPLHVNYDGSHTNIGGYLAVEVLDASGSVIKGYGKKDCNPLGGDSVDQIVTWGERKELPTGVGPIRLHFLMKNTSLYSFMAGGNVEVIDEPAGAILAALYTFENDQGKNATDVLQADGRQRVLFRGVAKVDIKPDNAAFGKRSMAIGSRFRPLNRLEIEGTSQLGTHFTLAAMVKSDDNRLARLFSNYNSSGPVDCSQLVFDFDPQGKVITGLRLMCKGIIIESDPVTFADNAYHHLAVTYDDGRVDFYLDGNQVGRQHLPGGEPVVLARNLLVGEDAELGPHEQLTGHIDDLLVLGRTLTADEVKTLSEKGAESCLQQLIGP